jgi:hypothetical protein
MARPRYIRWDDICCVIDQHIYSASSLKQQSTGRYTIHSDTLFWFRATQYLFLLLNDACLAVKQQIPISYLFALTRPRLETTIYRIRAEHANIYTTDAVRED